MITKMKELKVGDIAVLRNRDKCVYLASEENPAYPYNFFMSISGDCFLTSSFKEGFKHTSSKQYDIMKIYRNAISFNLTNGDLIYYRTSFDYKNLKTGDIVEFSLGHIGVVIEDMIMLQSGGYIIIKDDNIFSSSPYGRVIRVARDCMGFDSYDAGNGKVVYEEE